MHQVTAGVEFTGDYAITPFDLIYMNRARNVSGWLWAEKNDLYSLLKSIFVLVFVRKVVQDS